MKVNYQSLSISIILIIAASAIGCGHYYFQDKSTTLFPDGRTVVEYREAKVRTFAHDADINDFVWQTTNTTVRLGAYKSTGGTTNFLKACETIESGFEALKATAEAAK